MSRPRLIPVLLIKGGGLVKSVRFKGHKYIGDVLNAVKIFSALRADELILLDIEATVNGKTIDTGLVKEIGEEAAMPFSVGGGIATISQIQQLLAAGAEKVVLGSVAAQTPAFVKTAAATFGSSSIAVCIDYKKSLFAGQQVRFGNAKKLRKGSIVDFARLMQKMGAGELILQCVDNDGKMMGYDLQMLKEVSNATTLPLVALGGAGTTADLREAHFEGRASAVAAGSLFVFQNNRRGVLINYPSDKIAIFKNR